MQSSGRCLNLRTVYQQTHGELLTRFHKHSVLVSLGVICSMDQDGK